MLSFFSMNSRKLYVPRRQVVLPRAGQDSGRLQNRLWGGRNCSLWGLAFTVAIALVCESCALILQSGLPCSLTFPEFLPPADTQPIQRQLQRPPGCRETFASANGGGCCSRSVPCARHAFLFGAAGPPVLGTDIAGEQQEKVSG